ncbi:hypothetical protein [Granulicella sp. dw_53]|uniref:hypothetical protein n=1 Tax=Granulicella sp. dw_53 TaxID=2719792 RepID=UPI001BD3EA8A|nr:hypothetical protein [Granulicella sp. dw_53]
MIHFFRFNKAAANEIYAGSSGSAAEERRIREIRGANNKGRRVGDDGRRIMVAEVMYGIAAATAALFLLVTTL